MQITVTLDLNDRAGTHAKVDDLCATVAAYYAEKDRVAKAASVTTGFEDQFGAGACAVYRSLLKAIACKGEATLDDAAADTGWSIPTIRAHLMNAGRTAKAKGIVEPVESTWNHERQCAVYTA